MRLNPFVLLNGDAATMLDLLPDASVQCCVTSPAYFGLRNYGHEGQLGLEKTPKDYVASLVTVFAEVWRVLKPDGTLWLNLGDSYAANGGAHGGRKDNQPGVGAKETHLNGAGDREKRQTPNGLKAKDLIGIPWRVAFALQSSGWYLRSDIIWHKPNPMPESVTDRPTRAHEYIFLLTKGTKYFYDADAIREQASPALIKQVKEGYNGNGVKDYAANGVQNGSAVKSRIIEGARKRIDKQRGHSRRHDGFNDRWDRLTKAEQMALGANKRDVWSVAPANFKGAHFATFPPKLITPCILAGSRPDDVILDPFLGSGTTAEVALSLGRKCYGIELNPEYLPLIRERVAAHLPKRAYTLDDF